MFIEKWPVRGEPTVIARSGNLRWSHSGGLCGTSPRYTLHFQCTDDGRRTYKVVLTVEEMRSLADFALRHPETSA